MGNQYTAAPEPGGVTVYTRDDVDGSIEWVGDLQRFGPEFEQAVLDIEFKGRTPERVAEARRIGYAWIDAQNQRLGIEA
ncbi:MAG: hypothetical protein FWG25_00395 [Promicromonosporaceae bacterium]|nr:hypothetical protein [Promicromonosporaceae bacterium]